MHQIGFGNAQSDNVDVIYVPCYLNGNDGIFSLNYYELLIGMDVTVFPSYYEPWGYTPLESVAFGVPTVTTSLSGFGQWILHSTVNNFEESGVTVAGRSDSNYDAVVDTIGRALKFLSCADKSQTEIIYKSSLATAARANWSLFVGYYNTAFDVALKNERIRNSK